MMNVHGHGVGHLPLLSLLLGVMPEDVRRREEQRFEPVTGNVECAMWLSRQRWPKAISELNAWGFQFWVERGETAVWCYGAGWVMPTEAPKILTVLWETIETGQKARLLFHPVQGPPKLMVISKNEL